MKYTHYIISPFTRACIPLAVRRLTITDYRHVLSQISQNLKAARHGFEVVWSLENLKGSRGAEAPVKFQSEKTIYWFSKTPNSE